MIIAIGFDQEQKHRHSADHTAECPRWKRDELRQLYGNNRRLVCCI